LPCASLIPPVLPPSQEKLPGEKRADNEREREEKRKRQAEAQKAKKKTVFNTIGSAMANVATAATDAFTTLSEDFAQSQASGAETRFRKYFPGFPQERLLGEYECRLVSTPESVIHGRCYISTSFLSFHAEGHGKYILVMLPLRGIQSLQKAVLTKPPPGIPSNYPPQFHIVMGGILPASVMNSSNCPKVDSLVVYTQDNMQHMFFDIHYFDEMYNVLDHAWRDSSPPFNNPEAGAPSYASVDFISKAMQQQVEAYEALIKFRQKSNNVILQQQQEFQQQFPPESMSDQEGFQDFLEQQNALQQDEVPPYPPAVVE